MIAASWHKQQSTDPKLQDLPDRQGLRNPRRAASPIQGPRAARMAISSDAERAEIEAKAS